MTSERAITRHPLARAAASALLIITLASCASPGAQDLTSRAQREADRALTATSTGSFTSIPLPPGLTEARVAPATDPRAFLSLEDTLAQLDLPERTEPAAPSEPALRLYTKGRAALIDNNPNQAIELLTKAVEEDPSAAAAWRDLAEAQRLAGDRFAADTAHRRAIEANPYERRSLLRLGLDAATRRDFTRAIELLARIDIESHPGDPAERHLVWSALGQSFIETGALTAGTELLAKGMDLPDAFSRPTQFRSELELLYRNRSDAWTAIGDAHARLDSPPAALIAYQRASAYPTFDPVGLLARRVYTLLAQRRPASAALELITSITAEDTLTLEDKHLELIAYLRQTAPPSARIAPELESAITTAAAALTEQQRRQLAGRIALARAAASTDEQAAQILRDRLAAAPDDSAAITQLLARTNADNPAALTKQVAALIEANPLNERVYTRTAISLAGGAEELLAALPETNEDRAVALLRARLLTRLARFDDAEETLTDIIATDTTFAPAVSALTELLLSQRRLDEASAVIERLDPTAGQPALLAKAQGLASLGRTREALDLLTQRADAPDATPAVVYQLGTLLERLGMHEQAADRYSQAITLDPLLEQAHAARIRLFNQNAPLANREKLFAAVRDLREAIPSARTLRWLRAQELATSGQYGPALRALRDLADEQDDPFVERALVSVWIATSSADDAETWLRDKLTERPADSSLTALLARALTAQSKFTDAAQVLRDELNRRPGDTAISIQLENLLRQHLNQPAEADALTLQRLENAPPNVTTGLQLADVWMRQARFEDAALALTQAFENAPAVRPEELRAALTIAQNLGVESQTNPALRPLAIDLLDAIIDRDTPLPEPAHRLRAILLAMNGAPNERILSALARAYQDAGPAADTTTTATAQTLVQQDRPADAAAVIETLLSAQPTVNPTLATLWLSLVAQYPDPESAQRLIDFLSKKNAAKLVYAEALARPDADQISEQDAASELAHAIAQSYGGADNNQAAATLYRVALRYNPAHVMANNNLGYQLLVDGADLDEAERLIQTAYDGDPNSAAVIDSLGWARYLRGVLHDETDSMGIVTREGAIPLLERAVQIGTRDEDPGLFELYTHLGDAYWRDGRQDLALAQWKAGRLAAQTLLSTLGNNAPEQVVTAFSELSARIDAAEAGEPAPITPLASETPAQPDTR